MPRATAPRPATGRRSAGPLSRQRIVREAIALADETGVDAVSMRRLAGRLGVDPMSLYNHVGNKDDLLGAMVDTVVGDVVLPARTGDWATDLRATVLAARAAMLRHPWAAPVLEGRRAPGPASIGYMDTVMDILREGGMTLELTHHAIHLLGSRVLGFSQDLFEDKTAPRPDPAMAAAYAAQMAATHPRVAEMAMAVSHDGGVGGCDDDVEFAFALDLILEGLARRTA